MMWDEIVTLWRTERSAVETYEQALGERQWNQLQGRQVDRLVNILSDHLDAAAQLHAQIHKMGTKPVNGLKPFGGWFRLGTRSSNRFGDFTLFSDEAAIHALKEAEESTLKSYNDILDDVLTPIQMKPLIQNLVVKQRSHIVALDKILRVSEQSEAQAILAKPQGTRWPGPRSCA